MNLDLKTLKRLWTGFISWTVQIKTMYRRQGCHTHHWCLSWEPFGMSSEGNHQRFRESCLQHRKCGGQLHWGVHPDGCNRQCSCPPLHWMQETVFGNKRLHTSLHLSKFILNVHQVLHVFKMTTFISYNIAKPVLEDIWYILLSTGVNL